MAMCVMAVAPCQCFSPGSNHITSPGPISSIGPPALYQATASRHDQGLAQRVAVPCCPSARLECDTGADRACRIGCLEQGSVRTAPVKYSAGPFPEGCEPLLLMSIFCIPPFCIVLVTKRVNSVSHVLRCRRQPAAPQRVALV